MSTSSPLPRRKKLVPLPINTGREELARAQRWYQVTAPRLNRLYDRERRALVQARLVLDVGCGAGLWCVDQARTHPSTTYFGIDLDRRQIMLATMHAEVEYVRNALFSLQDMNHLDPHSFRPDTFGFIHIAQIAQALLSTDYQRLASSMYQLLLPGGILSWTEAEFPLTTSKALDTIISLLCQALDEAGHRFTPHTRFEEIMAEQRELCGLPEPHRRNLQITAWMPYWLSEAGFVELDEVGHLFSLQAGTELHAAFVEQVDDALTKIKPFLLRHRVLDGKRIDALCGRALKEMRRPDFGGLLSVVTLCARKPDPHPAPLVQQGQQETGVPIHLLDPREQESVVQL
jgi:SAM-dependent methyltransferase